MDETPEFRGPVRTLTDTVLRWFVDRERALRCFGEMLAAQDSALVLVVEGPTGIGKTWLLRKLDHEAEAQAVPASVIDFEWGEAFDDLLLVQWSALELGAQHFETIRGTLEEATKLEVVLTTGSGPGVGGVEFHGPAEVHGDVAGRDIIKGNTFNVDVGEQMIRLWQERVNAAFFADLRQLGLARGAVLLYDSFEQSTDEATLWIKNRLLRLLGQGELPGVRVVIAGKRVPGLPWDWRDLVTELRLDAWCVADVRRYLKDKRSLVIGESVVASIYDLTRGRPDQVAACADVYAKNPNALPGRLDRDRLLEILVEATLQNADARTRDTLRVAAIAEWFDERLLADLLGATTGVDERLIDLQAYSFIQAGAGDRLRFLPSARRAALKTWEDRPAEIRQLHSRGAQHFDKRARGAADPRLRDEFERQAVGHLLAIRDKESVARDQLIALYEKNESRYRLAVCQRLLERAEAVEGLSDLTLAWLRYLQGRLAFARNDYARSAALFEALLLETDSGSQLHALAGWSLGRVAAEQGEWVAAIDRYKSSLRYFAGHEDPAREGQVMLSLGDVYLRQAMALGGPVRPTLWPHKRGWQSIQAVPALLVSLPFVVFARVIRRWRLPPLHHGMNYRNWTLARLLLTAKQRYTEAESRFTTAGQESLVLDARLRLAQTYHRLGWWHHARSLFDQVTSSRPVVDNAYRQAQVSKEYADTKLAAGKTDEAIDQLEKSLQVFTSEAYSDVQAQAETRALLGYAWLQEGQFERGLAQFRESLEGFSSLGDRLGTGLALHALRRWVETSAPTSEQVSDVEGLIASTPEKAYFPRVQDRSAAVMERVVSIGLLLLGIAGLIVVAIPLPSATMSGIWARVLSLDAWLGLLVRLVLFVWVYTLGSGLLGLPLVMWQARQKLRPARLNRIVTGQDAISRLDHRGQETSRISWREVEATLSVERVVWQRPIPLLSKFWLFGSDTAICVPATMMWYDALKRDIEDHLREHGVRPIRRHLDVHLLRSPLGLLFALCPILLGLGSLIVWNLIELPLPIGLAAIIGPAFTLLGLMALVAGPYWWLALYPVWVRYNLVPRSRMPMVIGGLGLIIVAFAFFMNYRQPFFPIRHWLDGTLHPLGFLWILAALVWLLLARERAQKPVAVGRPVYPTWIRGAAAIALLGAVLLTGLFVQRAGAYVYVLPIVTHFSRDDYPAVIAGCSHALRVNDGLADGYFLRAMAYSEIGEHELALSDLTHLIDSGNVTLTHYLWFRAQEYKVLGDPWSACADLKSALGAQHWQLNEIREADAREDWREWQCDRFEDIAEGGGGPSP